MRIRRARHAIELSAQRFCRGRGGLARAFEDSDQWLITCEAWNRTASTFNMMLTSANYASDAESTEPLENLKKGLLSLF